MKKAEYFSASVKRPAESEHDQSPQRKRVKLDGGADVYGNTQPKASTSKAALIEAPPKKKPTSSARENGPKPQKSQETPLAKLASNSGISAAAPRTQKEKEEDAYITYLESKLGYGKSKGKKARHDDGLDGEYHVTCCL